MGSKATPIEQLPNVQMETQRENFGNAPMPPQPPQPMNNPGGGPQGGAPQGATTQMAEQIAAQQQAEQMANQEQFRQRQFVPQYPPSHDPFSGQQMPPQPVNLPPQPQFTNPQQMHPMMASQMEALAMLQAQQQGGAVVPASSWTGGYLGALMGNAKTLFLLAVLLFFVQMEGVQQVFRKLARAARVPDGMVFTGAKVIGAVVATLVFFLVKKNLG